MFTLNSFNIPEKANMVSRFAGTHMINHRSSISEHSFEVAYYALLLTEKWSHEISFLGTLKSEILEYAILHDVPEIYTGDLPYPVKKAHPEAKELFNKIEVQFMEETLPQFTKKQYHPFTKFIVKYCDTLAVAREIIEEIDINNKEFIGFYHNINTIFTTLYDRKELHSYEEWDILKQVSKNLLDELGINKYVEVPTVD